MRRAGHRKAGHERGPDMRGDLEGEGRMGVGGKEGAEGRRGRGSRGSGLWVGGACVRERGCPEWYVVSVDRLNRARVQCTYISWSCSKIAWNVPLSWNLLGEARGSLCAAELT